MSDTLHNDNIGFTLSEKNVHSTLPPDFFFTFFLYLYDVIGYAILLFVYIFYTFTLKKNKTTPPSYHDNFLLSTVLVGISLMTFECIATVGCIILNGIHSTLLGLVWWFTIATYIFFLGLDPEVHWV